MNKDLIKKQIEELEAKVQELKEELNKPKEFKWKYSVGNSYFVGSHFYGSHYSGEELIYLDHGRYRVLKENAAKAVERNRVANRLEALYEQIEIEMGLEPFKADWSNEKQYKASVYYNEILKVFKVDLTFFCCLLGTPYTYPEVADRVVEMLNNKEVVL